MLVASLDTVALLFLRSDEQAGQGRAASGVPLIPEPPTDVEQGTVPGIYRLPTVAVWSQQTPG